MKKIFLLLAVVGMTVLQSCEGDAGPQGEPGYSAEAEVFEIRNVNFINDGGGNYTIIYDLNPAILNSDMILMYRLAGVSNGLDIWEQMPKTYYFNNGEELDYNFDFTTNDINVNLGYTDSSVLQPAFIQNQVFRVVVIPGYLSNKVGADLSYDNVKSKLNITDEDFKQSARK